MAKQTINVGSADLAGDGESIRNAFTKVNSNFTEVYTQVPLATTATYTQSFNTSTLVRAAVSATNIVNGTWTLALSTAGTVTFPNGLLKIAGNKISNYVVNNLGGGSFLSSGSQLEVAPTKTAITYGVTNSISSSSLLTSQYLFQVSTASILSSQQTINTLDDATLTSELITELNSDGFKIGQRVTNNLGTSTISAFSGWTFGTDGSITLPELSGQIGRSGYTNGIDLYNDNGTGYVRMNYADESFMWADSGGAHFQTTGGTWDFGTDGSTTFPNDVKLKSGSNHSLSIGYQYDPGTQGTNAVAIGAGAGSGSQGDYAVAFGTGAGQNNQGMGAVAMGYVAGGNYQSGGAVAIGQEAGTGGGASGGTYNPTGSTGTTLNLVAPGANNPVVPGMKVVGTGFTTQTVVSVNSATQVILSAPPNSTPSGTIQFIPAQGLFSIAIGFRAGGGNNTTTVPQANGTIVLNASNVALSGVPQQTDSFYVNPIRNSTATNILYYNTTTKEITYNSAINVVTEVKSEFNPYFRDANGTFAGTATISASYVLHGLLCHWHLQVEFLGTTNYGNSQYQMTLPFPAHSTITTTNGTLHQVGGGGGSGADTRYAIAGQLSSDVSTTVMKFWYRSGTSDAMWKYNTPGGVPPGNPTGPAYWAVAGDAHFDISGTYQIA